MISALPSPVTSRAVISMMSAGGGELREREERVARAALEALAEDHDVAVVEQHPLVLRVAGDVDGEVEARAAADTPRSCL